MKTVLFSSLSILLIGVFVFFNLKTPKFEFSDPLEEDMMCTEVVEIEVLNAIDCPGGDGGVLQATAFPSAQCTGTLMYQFTWSYEGAQIRNFIAEVGVVVDVLDNTTSSTGNVLEGEYTLSVINVDPSSSTSSFGNNIPLEAIDIEAPEITCPGDLNENEDTNGDFTVPDYIGQSMITDNCEVDSITQMPAAGTVQSADFMVTITADDTSGNEASCNFQVTLIDANAPILTTVSIASNNSVSTLASEGDIITISFTANELIQTPTVTVLGTDVIPTNTSGDNWEAEYTVNSTDQNGTVDFIIEYTDLDGNVGPTVTTTTDNSEVEIDTTEPLLSSVTMSSSNANPAIATEGDILTLRIESSEEIETPSMTILGTALTPSNPSGNIWEGTYEVQSSDANGTVTFSVEYIDLAGNEGVIVTTTTDGSTVEVENTLSIDAIEMDITMYPNPVVDILMIASDTQLSEISVYDLSGKQMIKEVGTTNKTQIDMRSLTTGIYFVRVDGKHFLSSAFKIIKQ